MSAWDHYAECRVCGTFKHVPMAEKWFIRNAPCNDCGNIDYGPVIVRRWVSTGRLFKPSTWGTGYWEAPQAVEPKP